MTSAHFRLAVAADRAACGLIYRNARKAAFHWEAHDGRPEAFDDSTRGETLWVAEDGDGVAEVVAFASVWRAVDHWYLHNLFVAPGHQRGGIGRGLLRHVLGEIGRPVELKTDGPNLVARRFYETFGFRSVEEGRRGQVPWIRMRLA